ncbi:uncharacterized protein SPAPADRAFT_68621 [Spathaspora passalidarum NRRL Y-27907]|uniref:Uncharacterized protein n=1 Tax=Spathaspora passalidarum (strain NRRL Y-27907 / 11-Y1) TaxID=619300 RepID=G3AUF8_SPAPN|nr:uncharacterized protein SPAPADRAFT_68621 [Spathaspora passalidarum NRRL Y-27907]EGW30534.1 hypothetical protein SPAPADRAFT_68621 [Spathaspora passalidarum NRRL Y-27907]
MALEDNSDNDTVDDEVKELMSAALTYGNDQYFSPDTQPTSMEGSSSDFSTLRGNGGKKLQKLTDEHGNEYLLQPNGYVHPIRKPEELFIHPDRPQDHQIMYGTNNMYTPDVERRPTSSSKSSRKLKSFIDLSRNGKHSTPDQLREFQIKVLDSIQYSGDLVLGTTNRYGDVDSTAKIIRSATNSTRSSSISSSFRTGTLRTSSISSPSQNSVKFEKKKDD